MQTVIDSPWEALGWTLPPPRRWTGSQSSAFLWSLINRKPAQVVGVPLIHEDSTVSTSNTAARAQNGPMQVGEDFSSTLL